MIMTRHGKPDAAPVSVEAAEITRNAMQKEAPGSYRLPQNISGRQFTGPSAENISSISDCFIQTHPHFAVLKSVEPPKRTLTKGRKRWSRAESGRQRPFVFNATAARMRAFNAISSSRSPSRMSMARLTLPSRLELKRRDGSGREAPLAKVSLILSL